MAGSRSPFDDPIPRGYDVVLATLRIAVAILCWGSAGARLASGSDFGLGEHLVQAFHFSQSSTDALLDNIAWGLTVSGLLTLVRPCWPVLVPVTLWFATLACVGIVDDSYRLQPVTQAIRYLAPLSLLVLDLWPPACKFSLGRAMVGLFFLRLGIVVTMAGEGLLALQQSRSGGPLADQLGRALEQVFHWSGSSEQVQTVLGVIGGVYVGLALGLLLVRSRAIALLITAVAAFGAMSYVVGQGSPAWPQSLLHASISGAAFTLFLYWWRAVKEQPAITVPA
ncbi:MAG: hypothetical protein ACK5Q5_08235 [Planctomycetaceae bacterium]